MEIQRKELKVTNKFLKENVAEAIGLKRIQKTKPIPNKILGYFEIKDGPILRKKK